MKIRTSFVANSSSSSFIVCIDRDEIKSPEDISYKLCNKIYNEFDLDKSKELIYKHLIDFVYKKIQENSLKDISLNGKISIDYELDFPYTEKYLEKHSPEDFYKHHVWFSIADSERDAFDINFYDLFQDPTQYFSNYPLLVDRK